MSADPGPATESGDKVDILVVDDLPSKLLVLQTILQDLGQNVVLARSGAEALREVLKREFAVILLDVNMPDIDGLETAGLIRSYKKSALTPIIFITAFSDEVQTLRGYALGAVDYIYSPVIPDVLRSKVKVFVDLHQMQKRIRSQAEERIARERAEAGRRAAEENMRRFNFLARASHELSGSLERSRNARRLLDLVVPEIAPLALLQLDVNEAGGATELHVVTPQQSGWGAASDGRMVPAALLAQLHKARDEKGILNLTADMLAADESCRTDWPRDLKGGVVLPLRIGERSLGALALVEGAAQTFNAQDLSMLEELAGRAAIAFDNARLYSNLQQEIVERQEAELRLEEASRRKDEFLAMLSHELRNPLAPIVNAVEVMRRTAPGENSLAWARDIIERQVTHLRRLVDDLLDVARIAQGKVSLCIEQVQLSAIVEHAIETVQPLIASKRHELVLRLPQIPVWLAGDLARLAQVVANLLNNAAKYTPPGGHIELAAGQRDGNVFITVRDNGVGIDTELLPQVFDLFTQGKRSLDRSQGGLGIGLTLVRQLVEQHGGRVEALSEGSGKGATFSVYLPMNGKVVAIGASGSQSIRARNDRRRRILVVDDNRDTAESMSAILGLEGHEVWSAMDGVEALGYASRIVPDVVLLDIGLPNISGYEVANLLMQDPRLRGTLLIALTGYGQPADTARTAACGFHHHFVKPVEPQRILDAIRGWGRADQV